MRRRFRHIDVLPPSLVAVVVADVLLLELLASPEPLVCVVSLLLETPPSMPPELLPPQPAAMQMHSHSSNMAAPDVGDSPLRETSQASHTHR